MGRKYPKIEGLVWNRIRDASVRRFIADVKSKCDNHSVKLVISRDQCLLGKLPVNGYFEAGDKDGTLWVHMHGIIRTWLPLIVHEYSHMLQWIADCAPWRKGFIGGDDTSVLFDKWVTHRRNFKRKKLLRIVELIQDVERDCERRALKLIEEYGLPISLRNYARRANAYLYFYTYAYLRRRWYDNKKHKPPYEIKEISQCMPPVLLKSYNCMSLELISLYDKYYMT